MCKYGILIEKCSEPLTKGFKFIHTMYIEAAYHANVICNNVIVGIKFYDDDGVVIKKVLPQDSVLEVKDENGISIFQFQ